MTGPLRTGTGPPDGCPLCAALWEDSDGCEVEAFTDFIDGIERERIVVGDERDLAPEAMWAEGYCGDCGADVGQPHHGRCELERCPRCEEQAIGCECLIPGQARNLVSARATSREQLLDEITGREGRRE